VITSINGFCLVALFLAYLFLGVRYHVRTRPEPAPRLEEGIDERRQHRSLGED
jgi:hypothetical protein